MEQNFIIIIIISGQFWPYSGECKQIRPSASGMYCISNMTINSLGGLSLMNNSSSCRYNEECSRKLSTEHVVWGVYYNTLGKILPIRFYFSGLSFRSWNLQYYLYEEHRNGTV